MKPIDSVAVTTPAHASDARWAGVVVDVRADDRIRVARRTDRKSMIYK